MSLVWGTCQSGDPKSAVVVGVHNNSLKSLLHWGWLNLWLTVQTGISNLDFVLAFHFSPLWMNGAALRTNYIDAILVDKVLMMTHLDLRKRFPIYHVCPNCLAALLCRLALRKNASTSLQVSDEVGNDTGRLVTWEFPLRTDSASWKSFESFIQFTSFCNSCTLPDNTKIVFWSSMSFRLAIASKLELWNFRNSSISLMSALLRLELLGVRDDWLLRDIPQELSVFAPQVES